MPHPTQSSITAWQFQDLTLELRHNAAGGIGVIPAHSHDAYQFILSEHMVGQYHYRSASHIAPVASLLIIHPGEVHTARGLADAQPDVPLRNLYAQPSLLKRVSGEMAKSAGSLPFFPIPVLLDSQTFHQFLHLHRVLEGAASDLEKETVVLHVFAHLLHRHTAERSPFSELGKEHRAIQRVRDYLHTHYAESIALQHLADIAELSPFHLCRVFCRDVGLPPHAYQTQERITQAKSLLAQGRPLGEVAHETGFADQAHFTRKFKRLVGVTPGNYRIRASSPK